MDTPSQPEVVLSPLLVSEKDVAALLGVSTRTVRRLRDDPNFPKPVRVGGSVRWRVADVESYVASLAPSA